MKFHTAAVAVFFAATAFAQQPQRSTTMHATGTFKVDIKPVDASTIGQSAGLGRMTIDKVWSGSIQGTSLGEMMTAGVDKSMAYVAVEKMNVSVEGHAGSFYFLHQATMNMADAKSGAMQITVMPQSGTGALSGIEGTLNIVIEKGSHSYTFDYTLPAK